MMDTSRRIYLSTFLSVFLLVIGITGLTLFAWHEAVQREHDRTAARYQLCVEVEKVKQIQRGDLTKQIGSSRSFLREHPNGIPGIPRSLILKGIADKQETLRALAPVNCKEFSSP